jgi:hypothetical protein
MNADKHPISTKTVLSVFTCVHPWLVFLGSYAGEAGTTQEDEFPAEAQRR